MLFRLFQFFGFLAFIGLFLWTAGFISFLVSLQSQKTLYPDQKTEAIVVLTGGKKRMDTGFDLWSELYAPELFISGVNEQTNRKEILSNNGKNRELPLCCLTLDFKSTNTVENALNTKEWIERNYIQNIRLVTSDYHMRRALLEFKTILPDLKIIAHPVKYEYQDMLSYSFARLLVREYNKSVVRRFEIMTGHQWIPQKNKEQA